MIALRFIFQCTDGIRSLGKGVTIASKTCFASNVKKLMAPVIIKLMEGQVGLSFLWVVSQDIVTHKFLTLYKQNNCRLIIKLSCNMLAAVAIG